eukprot:m.17476 g.17476  ORF g.17476 m.17476 type:complete len:116 (-) comp3248_c0_seq2:349-696(-)
MAQTFAKAAQSAVKLAANSPHIAKGAVKSTQEFLASPEFVKTWGTLKKEFAFPGPSEWPAVQKGFKKLIRSAQTGAFANLTVSEAAKNTLVFAEICTFFYVGEIIGRGSVIGYDV